MNLPPAFQKALGDLSRTAQYIVGVSGGCDSVCLLRALHESGFSRLVVGHLNHGIRGRKAAADLRFVEKLAASLGFQCLSRACNVSQIAKAEKVSVETAGRNARRELFAEAGREFRCHRLLLAHHLDDQGETVLFQILRGTASPTGMRPINDAIISSWKFQVYRPFLSIPRCEIRRLAAEKHWKFREDETNANPAYTRNRLRHEVVPLLNKVMGRAVAPALGRLAEISADEADWMETMTPSPPEGPLELAFLKQSPTALRRRIIFRWLRDHRIPNIGFKEVELVLGVVAGKSPACNLPGNHVVRKKAARIQIDTPTEKCEPLRGRISKISASRE